MEYSQQDHLVSLIRERTHQHPGTDHPAMRYAKKRQWLSISWQELGESIDRLSLALLSEKMPIQATVGIWSRNMPEWTIADLGILQIRAITVPLYPTSTPDQVRYILDESEVSLLFVGEQEQYDQALRLLEQCPSLKKIVAFDSSVDLHGHPEAQHYSQFTDSPSNAQLFEQQLKERLAQRSMKDLLTLIYTSGTTGEPKGVMLDYNNLAASFSAHDQILKLDSMDISICFLPLSHIFERGWSFYVLSHGAENVYIRDPQSINTVLRDIKPTVLCAVPRFYEKIYSMIQSRLAGAPSTKRLLFRLSFNIASRHLTFRMKGKTSPFPVRQLYALADKLVFSNIKAALGGRIRFMPCGGARLDDDINHFFQAIGIHLLYGYGMTETTATVTCFRGSHFQLGSCGSPLPDIQIRIGNDGEILIKGDSVMRGYYKKREETARTFEDGWLKTGDAGLIDENGNLIMTERIKELMKTSNGKYIAPQHIEGTLGKDQFIEQIAIIADARNYVSALIVPAFAALEEHARALNIKYQNKKDLICCADIQQLFQTRLNNIQQGLAKFERVKKFTLLPREFTVERGEITPTLKLRRKTISDRFHKEIESMYSRIR